MTPTISKELQEQIEREAMALSKNKIPTENPRDDFYDVYCDAAAIYAAKFEQAKKALEEMLDGYDQLSMYQKDWFIVKPAEILKHKALLASWKEEGKEGDHEG